MTVDGELDQNNLSNRHSRPRTWWMGTGDLRIGEKPDAGNGGCSQEN